MGDKDISEKALLRYADVFADIANVLLFDGEQRILPNDLTEVDPVSKFDYCSEPSRFTQKVR